MHAALEYAGGKHGLVEAGHFGNDFIALGQKVFHRDDFPATGKGGAAACTQGVTNGFFVGLGGHGHGGKVFLGDSRNTGKCGYGFDLARGNDDAVHPGFQGKSHIALVEGHTLEVDVHAHLPLPFSRFQP